MFASLKSFLLPPALVLFGVFMIFGAYTEGKNSKALADHGKTAVATVEGVEWNEKKISGREKGFKLDVHFETEDKKTITTKLDVPKEMGQRFRDNKIGTVNIKYLPEDPGTVVLEGHTDGSAGMYGIGAILIAAGVGIFVYRRRSKA